MTAAGIPQSQPAPGTGLLPPLREDLALLPAEPDELGAPGWIVHDPVRNRYFRIGKAAFEMLSRWSAGTIAELVRRVEAETVLSISKAHVLELLRFLHANQLIQRAGPESAAEFARIARAGNGPLLQRILHGYLFFRIPLWRPGRFLRRTQRLADVLASTRAQQIIGVLGAVGVLLTLRQWDRFVTTLLELANWQGVAWMALTLSSAKILHELGHAYTASRYGCRVPTMGIAFMVLYPVLYTDTSDAWRLRSREQRLRIGAAGIRVELALALLATLFWHLLPAGGLQSAVFVLASTTWLSTLFINLSPFMRFDGYYLLTDWLGVPNLQERSFALARWQLRETLLGLKAPPPEPLSARGRRRLIFFAYATWIYRFFLFLGIALLVYHFFFKLLGFALFVVELVWFIVRPIALELRVWYRSRGTIRVTRASMVLVCLVGILFALLAIPWRASIVAPALLRAGADAPLLSTAAGQIRDVLVSDGDRVAAGAPIVRMTSTELAHERASLTLELDSAEIALAQARAGRAGFADIPRLEQEVLRLRAGLQSLAAREAHLTIRSPIEGAVRELMPELQPGTWIAAKTPLARIVDHSSPARIVAYVSQSDIARLTEGAPAYFVPDEPTLEPQRAQVVAVDRLAAATLEQRELASPHGGPLLARIGHDGNVRAVDAVYRVTGVAVDGRSSAVGALALPMRGTLTIDAPAESVLRRAYERVVALLLMETSF